MRTDAMWFTGGRQGLEVPVTVIRTREAYGRTDALVRPVGGDGEAWVSESNLRPVNDVHWVLAERGPGERPLCDWCGWTIVSDTHYTHHASGTDHCIQCHPINHDHRRYGDSERAAT